MIMKQCTMIKDNTRQVSWIPAKFAEVGRNLRLKDEEGWTVEEVGGEMPYDRLMEYEKRFRSGNHRAGSDI